MKKITSFIFLFTFLFLQSPAQKKSIQVGVKFLNELTYYAGYIPGFGAQLVYEMGRHGGLESGIYYDNQIATYWFYSPGVSVFGQVAERRLTIPAWYHFHSKVLNFSGGPTISYFMGWKDKSFLTKVPSYNTNAFQVQGSAGVSKTINLSASIILEPEVRFNYIFSRDDGNLSLNLALRKKIF